MFGLPDFGDLAKPRDLAKIFEGADLTAWSEFRGTEDSRYVSLVLPHVMLRLDGVIGSPQALAEAVGGALGITLPPPPSVPPRLPPGRWRAYADVLAAPFAALTPVAVRLGYPDA